MALQVGIIKVKGKLQDLSFIDGKDSKGRKTNIVKTKGGVDGSRIKNDPNFSRTRENNDEFGRAGEAGKVIYNESQIVTSNARDGRVVSRLLAAFRANIEKDAANVRGQRQIQWEAPEEIVGFQFNQKRNFPTSYGGKLTAAKTAADVTVDLAAIVPMYDIKNQSEATHAKLEVQVIKIDANGEVTSSVQTSGFFSVIDETPTIASQMSFVDAATDAAVLVVVTSLKFYQELNGGMHLLYNKSYNASQILSILV